MKCDRRVLPFCLLIAVVLVHTAGCASRTPMTERSVDDIYEQSYREGGRDAIHMLRDAMREHGYHGMHNREHRTHPSRGAQE